MKNKIILWAVLAILGIQLITPVSATPSIWLYYDDGESDARGLGSNDPSLTPMRAVDFSYIETCTLLTIKYWISKDPNYDFNLHIMDSDWEDIYTSTVTPPGIGWNTVDLSEEGIIVSGQFIIGMQFLHNIPEDSTYMYVPQSGHDTDDPDGHSWFWPFYPDGAPGIDSSKDCMIRAEIEPLIPPVGGI